MINWDATLAIVQLTEVTGADELDAEDEISARIEALNVPLIEPILESFLRVR